MSQLCEAQSPYGHLEISAVETVGLRPSARPSRVFSLQCATCVWTPPADLQEEFPPEFSISFYEYQGVDTLRRFVPTCSASEFVEFAFAAGLALLRRDRQLCWEHCSTYRAMKLIFDRAQGMQEHLEREFNYSRDLFIRQRGRESDSQRSVLPECLWQDENGVEHTWSPSRLCAEGRLLATAAGVEEISTATEISYGLRAAAERNPNRIDDPEEVTSLMRMALFAPAQEDEEVTDECRHEVYGRLVDLLNAHGEDSDAEFQEWFRGAKNNLFKSIGGRQWKASIVRKAMLQLGWEAYRYVSDCISYFVQNFLRTLPVSLNCEERRLFDQMYQPQPYLGGLPVILLLERGGWIGPVIARLWTDPDDDSAVPVLHQLLAYYAEMASNRRAADRRSKNRRQQIEVAHSPLAASHSLAPSENASAEFVTQILQNLAERRGWRCEHCESTLEFTILVPTAPELCAGESITVEYGCPQHGNHCRVEVPLAELRCIADDLEIDPPD